MIKVKPGIQRSYSETDMFSPVDVKAKEESKKTEDENSKTQEEKVNSNLHYEVKKTTYMTSHCSRVDESFVDFVE